jgi:peptide deformylase
MIREILKYPDPRLREKGAPVRAFDEEFRTLVQDMAETMYDAPGVGLAAPQIGVALQLFVVDTADADEPSDFRVFANPEILATKGEVEWREGCLSFPDSTEDVARSEWVQVRAQNERGETFTLEADGLLAIAIQHEYDHLQGDLMIDRIGPLRKRMLHRKMLKLAEGELAKKKKKP